MMSNSIQAGLLWAGALIGSTILLKLAQGQHLIGADAVARGYQAALGVTGAGYANFTFKHATKVPATERGGRMQQVRRVVAWAMVVACLVYAVVSLAVPHPYDTYLADGAIVTAVMISIGCAIRCLGGFKAK